MIIIKIYIIIFESCTLCGYFAPHFASCPQVTFPLSHFASHPDDINEDNKKRAPLLGARLLKRGWRTHLKPTPEMKAFHSPPSTGGVFWGGIRPLLQSIAHDPTEHWFRPYGALLPMIQSTALYTYGVLLPRVQSTAPEGREDCSTTWENSKYRSIIDRKRAVSSFFT